MQSDIAMDTEVMSEIQAPPASGATDVTFEADRVDEHRFSEDHVSSDQEQPTSPEGVTVTADPGEMSGTESQQGEEFGEITVQEELTPEAAEECDDITVRLTNEQAEVETAFTSGKDQTSMVLATVEVMETEMVESATMRDVMEKCVAIESEKLVQNIEVEAHIEKRELGADIVSEHKDNISVDELEEQLHEQIIIDEDMDQSVTGVLKTKHIQNDRCADDMIIDDTNPTNDDGINDDSKSSEQKNDVKQVKDKVKGSTVTHLQRPGSQLNRKRKDDDSRTSKLQTKSSRHQQQSNPRRTNTKTSNQTLVVQSKVTNKMESEKKVSPNKMLKNVSNKKKAEKSLTKTTIGLTEKKGKPAEKNFDKEKSLAKVRKELDMLPSVPSENIAPHLKTIEVRPILENPSGSKKEDGVTGKSIRRSLPQRKFSMVKSQIDSGLRTSTKAEAKTRKSDMSQGSSVAKTAMQSRLSINQPSSGPSKRTSLSSTSATSNTGSKTSQTSKTKPGLTSGRTAKQSRLSLQRHQVETPVSSSQQSLSSDHSQSGATSERTPSKRKPSSFRERSSSTGSEYQGQQSSTADVKTVRSKPPSGRQSLLPAPGKRTVTDTRRSSASVLSSQGATSKLSKRSHSLVTSTPAPKRNISLAKSKTQKGGLSSSLSSSVKQNQQPDVVTNAISRSSVAKEITRLEALCEARTKELNKIKIELRRQNIGFEAVAIVVKYFTEELAEAKEQLKKAVLQLEELTRQRDALIDEIQSIKQQHAEETESLMSKHQEALSALSKKLTAQKEEEVKQVIEKHSHEVTTLKSFHERSIKELEEKHERLMAENSKQYEEELTRRRHDHEKQINDLHQEHESKLNEITMRFETIKLNLLEKVEFLRMEGEELRRREAAMTEKCQRESDYKIQHALAQYKQDVDSLTAVLDLRNGELRELQKQNLELQRELEKLPVAQEKIKSLEQQIENLQAIIDIRANNERSLSEKHHVLLRKYDKETKVMKRLSMDNEELMYRLQMESGYQDVMRRSISHSPTSSETSTPEPIRRHKSPLPHSPRSPCEPKRSPVQKTPPRSSMKRTGTYEVLPQEYDDMNNIKQSDI